MTLQQLRFYRAPVKRCTVWSNAILIVLKDESAMSSFSFDSCRDFHEIYENVLSTCILYFHSVGYHGSSG